MGSALTRVALACVLALVGPATARESAAQDPAAPPVVSGPWVMGAGASTTLRAECSECTPTDYVHTHSWLAGAGVSLRNRADIGLQLRWSPASEENAELNTTALLGVVRYRPWASRGFFVSGGAGIAWLTDVVDFVDEGTTVSATAKGLTVDIGAGWEFRVHPRLGLQVFGAQHVVTLGDLPTPLDVTLEGVVVNSWSVGGAIVFR